MVIYYLVEVNKEGQNIGRGWSVDTQKDARRTAAFLLTHLTYPVKLIDIYKCDHKDIAHIPTHSEFFVSRKNFIQNYKKWKLIGTVHIDRELPEYIDKNLRPHPLNKDGSFKKKGVC